MTSRTNQRADASDDPPRLADLLDKLVAVQIDLEQICGTGGERARIVASPEAIADACTVLHSAMADLRKIIHHLDGSAPASTQD